MEEVHPRKEERIMKCNVGKTDRIFRIVIGIVIVLLGIYFQSWWGAVGIIPLATGLLRWCPAYVPFGLSTCERKAEPR
jgi:hypothetical protein